MEAFMPNERREFFLIDNGPKAVLLFLTRKYARRLERTRAAMAGWGCGGYRHGGPTPHVDSDGADVADPGRHAGRRWLPRA